MTLLANWRGHWQFLRHAWTVMAGNRFWLLPLAPLLWLVAMQVMVYIDVDNTVSRAAVQGTLLGAPMTAIAIFLGIRIIGGEIDDGSLEIAYTVPGGVEKLWMVKLVAAFLMLLITEVILAVAVLIFFTSFPPGALYGAMQAACFYLVLSMAFGTLFKGETSGAIATLVILGINGFITGFGENQLRISPFYNPYVLADLSANQASEYTSQEELFAWTLQNRIGILIANLAILGLAFMRANRRETMLQGS